MKLKFFTTTLFLFTIFYASFCHAQMQYVRKQPKRPNFFIPDSEFNKQEKLPPFYYPTQQQFKKKVIQEPVEQEEASEDEEIITSQDTSEATETIQNDVMFEKDNKYALKLMPNSEEPAPAYTQKFDEYIKDLSLISKGKKINNTQLEKDLAQMDSNVAFEIE